MVQHGTTTYCKASDGRPRHLSSSKKHMMPSGSSMDIRPISKTMRHVLACREAMVVVKFRSHVTWSRIQD